MNDYNSLLKQSLDLKKKRDDRYKEVSKDRLFQVAKKKVQTTMIGALSSIETHLGFLWDSDGEMSEQQKMMYDLYQKLRSEILDKGNTQARNVDAELSQYEIKWLRYSVNIPVKETKSEE